MTIKVKPLVWEQEPRNGWKVGVVYARGYHLIRREDGWHIGNGFGFTGDGIFPDLEAAKAAAQADYEARILSAIEAVDPATIRADALRDKIAAKAREYAGHYSQSSDGRNTFLMFAEWVEALALIDKDQALVPPGVGWRRCGGCRAVGAVHCAHPDECGNMKLVSVADLIAQADSWQSWLDDLPLPDDFRDGVNDCQQYIADLSYALQPQPAPPPPIDKEQDK